ncbi:MAG: hypothetical protein EPN84_07075 [Legionella sp.]|nr:MAG: hypothetical protein EPN84_07075 [Legionella sp.]
MTNFNFRARAELKKNQLEWEKKNQFTPREIQEITQQALENIKKYQADMEKSIAGQLDYYQTVYKALYNYQEALWNSKNWWQKFISFFGFITPEERGLQNVINESKEKINENQEKHRAVHIPIWYLRVLDFFGIDLKNYLSFSGYSDLGDDMKLKYLSHHLMGSTNLNHYKELQGNSFSQAYQNFIDDINEFLNENSLDNSTREELAELLNKLNQSTVLTKEIEYAEVLNHLSDHIENDKLLDDYAFSVTKSLTNLPNGETLIIPHGSKSKGSAHAIVVEFKKISDGECELRIFDTSGSTELTSFGTQVRSLIAQDKTRPVKKTTPLFISNLANNSFINDLVSPLFLFQNNNISIEEMNKLFVDLMDNNQLIDDDTQLTLQTNGTCAHSSLQAWFKTRVSPQTEALFNSFIVKRALERLNVIHDEHLKSPVKHIDLAAQYNHQKEMYGDLKSAGEKTVAEAAKRLAKCKESLDVEYPRLKNDLTALLNKKGKSLDAIANLSEYSEKKLRGNKLSDYEKRMVQSADTWSPIPRNTIAQNGLFAFFSTVENPYASLSDRAQKAIIAKKLAAYETFNQNSAKLI